MPFVADPTKPKSMSKEAVKKRKQRAARRARQQAANESGDAVLTEGAKPSRPRDRRHPEQVAADSRSSGTATPAERSPLTFEEQRVPVHVTVPVTADDSPDKFTHIPEISAQPPIGVDPVVGTPEADPSVAAPEASPAGDAPRTDIPKPETTAAEAAVFGRLLVGYFQIGTASLFKKDPRTQQAFVGLAASLPEFQGPAGPVKLSPDQAYAALCGFIGGAAERCALKYNLRLPYVDEIVVAGAIGVATYGLIPKRKPKNDNANAAAQAKDANPAPNGKSTNPEAHAAAADVAAGDATAGGRFPGAAPINVDNAPDLDEMA